MRVSAPHGVPRGRWWRAMICAVTAVAVLIVGVAALDVPAGSDGILAGRRLPERTAGAPEALRDAPLTGRGTLGHTEADIEHGDGDVHAEAALLEAIGAEMDIAARRAALPPLGPLVAQLGSLPTPQPWDEEAATSAGARAGCAWPSLRRLGEVQQPREGWDDMRVTYSRASGDAAMTLYQARGGQQHPSPAALFDEGSVERRGFRLWRDNPGGGLEVLIEELAPQYHFRPYFMAWNPADTDARRTTPRARMRVSPANREHVAYLGAQLRTACARRRIYLDLGARDYESSVEWMLLNYPASFDAILAFEARPDVFVLPDVDDMAKRMFVVKQQRDASTVSWEAVRQYASTMRERIVLRELVVGTRDVPGHSIDLASLLLDDLRASRDDFIVIKMDVENAEWDIIPHLRQTGALDVISELMLEVHYADEGMSAWGWPRKFHGHSLLDAEDMFETLRHDDGVFVHAWP